MPTYKVAVTAVQRTHVEVRARDEAEAREKAIALVDDPGSLIDDSTIPEKEPPEYSAVATLQTR